MFHDLPLTRKLSHREDDHTMRPMGCPD